MRCKTKQKARHLPNQGSCLRGQRKTKFKRITQQDRKPKAKQKQFGSVAQNVFKSKVRLNSYQLCNLEGVLFYCMSNSYHGGNARAHCTGFLGEMSEIIHKEHLVQIYLIKGAPKCWQSLLRMGKKQTEEFFPYTRHQIEEFLKSCPLVMT